MKNKRRIWQGITNVMSLIVASAMFACYMSVFLEKLFCQEGNDDDRIGNYVDFYINSGTSR